MILYMRVNLKKCVVRVIRCVNERRNYSYIVTKTINKVGVPVWEICIHICEYAREGVGCFWE